MSRVIISSRRDEKLPYGNIDDVLLVREGKNAHATEFLIRRRLSRFQISWVRKRGEELHLLTIGLDTYASDSRFALAFEKPNDWRLLLRSATERDAGLYECQVSAHPPLIRTVHLAVSGE